MTDWLNWVKCHISTNFINVHFKISNKVASHKTLFPSNKKHTLLLFYAVNNSFSYVVIVLMCFKLFICDFTFFFEKMSVQVTKGRIILIVNIENCNIFFLYIWKNNTSLMKFYGSRLFFHFCRKIYNILSIKNRTKQWNSFYLKKSGINVLFKLSGFFYKSNQHLIKIDWSIKTSWFFFYFSSIIYQKPYNFH